MTHDGEVILPVPDQRRRAAGLPRERQRRPNRGTWTDGQGIPIIGFAMGAGRRGGSDAYKSPRTKKGIMFAPGWSIVVRDAPRHIPGVLGSVCFISWRTKARGAASARSGRAENNGGT